MECKETNSKKDKTMFGDNENILYIGVGVTTAIKKLIKVCT